MRGSPAYGAGQMTTRTATLTLAQLDLLGPDPDTTLRLAAVYPLADREFPFR